MQRWPRISIITPSLNQGEYIAETIESVLAQGYPNIEHIVIDGGSTDGTLAVLQRYSHLRIISEPDHGHADAVNKGFKLATGDIWGFLNSDDTLLPGALHRVAQEIDPGRQRCIVMGRCRFVDEHGRFIGTEHPSHFESHRRVLEIWKGHFIPQPAVFWTPEVWRTCGPMDDRLKSAWIDYDLFCKFSKKYAFHFIDQVLATYRLHSQAQTVKWTEAQRLEDCIQLSRRHWGSPVTLMYWQITLSLALYQFNRLGRGRDWLRQAGDAWRHRQVLRAIPYALGGGVLAPEVAFYVGIYPSLRNRAKGFLRLALSRLAERGMVSPQTAVHLEHTEPWGDGWAGPQLVVAREVPPGAQAITLQGQVDLTYMRRPFVLTASVDGKYIGQQCLEQSGEFAFQIPILHALSPGIHTVEVQASSWFVPHRFLRNDDFRPLAWRILDLYIA
jgi:glycosyltransferase involved in cell wall biosynthesis